MSDIGDMNSNTSTPTKSNMHTKQYDDLLERYGDGRGNIDFNKVDYDALPYEDYIELSHFWSSLHYYQPKPEHLKVDYIKRLYAWREGVEKLEDESPSHRRFNLTLQVPQLVNAFKKAVRKGEVNKETLLTVYRIVSLKLLADPTISDEDIKSMHDVIKNRVSLMYERRLAKRRRMVR